MNYLKLYDNDNESLINTVEICFQYIRIAFGPDKYILLQIKRRRKVDNTGLQHPDDESMKWVYTSGYQTWVIY